MNHTATAAAAPPPGAARFRHDRPLPAPTGASEPMRAVDRAWLEMDESDNPMVVNGVIELAGVRDLGRFIARLAERLLEYPRFRQRIVANGAAPHWIEDEALTLGYHLHVQRLPRRAFAGRLRELLAKEIMRPLDRSLPLWRITFFPSGAGRVTALFRAHHAIADGIALMRLLLSLADPGPAPAAPRIREQPHGPLGRLIGRLQAVNDALEQIGHTLAGELTHPAQLLHHLRQGLDAAGAVAHLLALPDNNPPRTHAPLSGRRSVAWSSDSSLAAVRRFAQARGVTLNDVFLAALAGAFRRWLAASGPVAADQNLRISIPVNLRAAGDGELGNGFGLVLLDLPVGAGDRGERLALVAQRMAQLKRSSEARAVLLALAAAGYLPPAAERNLVHLLAGKTAAVVSNLPGPRRALRLCGARLANLVFWPPQAGGIGIGVSLLSYAGRITIGVSADRAVLADPAELLRGFRLEMKRLLATRSGTRRPGARW